MRGWTWEPCLQAGRAGTAAQPARPRREGRPRSADGRPRARAAQGLAEPPGTAHDIPGLQLALAVGATTYLLRDRKRLSLRAPCCGRMAPILARVWVAVQDSAAL